MGYRKENRARRAVFREAASELSAAWSLSTLSQLETQSPKTQMETATVSLAFPASLHAFIDNDYRSQNTSKYNFDLIVACLLRELLHEKAESEAISPLTCGNSWSQ